VSLSISLVLHYLLGLVYNICIIIIIVTVTKSYIKYYVLRITLNKQGEKIMVLVKKV
jgi:hypothetical protein